MRITRSTLRRIIAEESARILAEMKKGHHEEDDIEGDEEFGEVDPHKMGEYQHAYSMGGGSDEEGFAIDYDTGRPSPFAAKYLPRPAPAVDDIEGSEDMGEVDPYEMGEYEHARSMGGGADEEGFYMDYDRGLDEGEEELDEGDPSYRDPGDDAGYAADLQRDLGAFTSPENIPGTMQYRDRERAAYYEKSGAPRNTSAYAEYDHLREDDEPLSEARWAKLAGVLKG
jgi:hypothetical protein